MSSPDGADEVAGGLVAFAGNGRRRAADDAQRHFDMFADDDSGLYEKIEVVPLCAPCEAVLSRLFPVMGGGV